MNTRSIALAVSYAVSGMLFIFAFQRIIPNAGARQAIAYAGAGLIMAVLASRFLSNRTPGPLTHVLPLLSSLALGGAAVLYGLVQITPGEAARAFVGFAGAGVLIGALGWRFLSEVGFVGHRQSTASASETEQQRDTRWTRDTVLVFSYVGTVGILLFAIRSVVPPGPVEGMFRVMGAGLLIGCGSLLTGALLGFLFGIPRAPATVDLGVQPAAPDKAPTAGAISRTQGGTRFQVNTNLEQISDWLTKIIVGLGLINLARIPTDLDRLARYFSRAFGALEGREAITLTLIVAFAVCGFLLGYLLTRLFLTGAFIRAESPGEQLKALVNSVSSPGLGDGPSGPPPPPISPAPQPQGAPAPLPPSQPLPGGPVAPEPRLDQAQDARSASLSPSQLVAALEVNRLADQVRPQEVRAQMLALTNEYDVARASMPYSDYRTQVLDGIVARMRVISGAALWMLPELAKSSGAGERLAAIAMLQMRPDSRYTRWLAERCRDEQPFLQYHAALALRNAADQVREEDRESLRSTIEAAKGSTRDQGARSILEEALKMLERG